jgi:hypothetical protein
MGATPSNDSPTSAQGHIILKNHEFAFVTLDSWDLRVQLPREARDKAVVLPPYLQLSRECPSVPPKHRYLRFPLGAQQISSHRECPMI